MMKAVSAALLLAISTSATAQDRADPSVSAADAIAGTEADRPAPRDYASMTDAQLAERMRDIGKEGFNEACRDKVPLFAELAKRNPATRGYDGMKLAAEAYCASEERRFADGLELVKTIEAQFGATPIDQLGLFFAYSLQDGREIASRLRKMNASGRLAQVPSRNVAFVMATAQRRGQGADIEALAYEVTRSAQFDRMPVELQATFASYALSHAAATGALDHAETLLPHVRSPHSIMSLLALRKYEPIWPQVEEYAGDNLARVSIEYASWTANRLVDRPEDADRLSEHSQALMFAGRYREAAKLAEDWLAQSSRAGQISEGDGWALNVQAEALDAIGDTAAADRVFDRLAEVPAATNPWVVNFVINRAARLIGLGRWEEGLAASGIARNVADEHGTPYARMLVAGYRTCALSKLGRSEEAELELQFVRASPGDAANTAATALLCTGHEDEAIAWLGKALRDEISRAQLLEGLQEDRFSLVGTTAALPSVREVILANDALRTEALKHVRLLPERFVPLSYLRREQAGTAPR